LGIENNQQECRAKLLLGKPTEQTIFFLHSLIQLLKDTVSEKNTDEVIEKRKLLFPLFASLSIEDNNTLFSNDLHYEWFGKRTFDNNTSEYPKELLQNWCIKQEQIDKILQFSAEIVNSSETFILAKAEPKINLFDTDVLLIRDKNFEDLQDLFDKWIALLVGNVLYNSTENVKRPKLFNTDYKIDFQQIFKILKYSDFPFDMYKGIDMRQFTEGVFFSIKDFIDGIDFSYSYLKGLYFGDFVFATFQHSVLENVSFDDIYFRPNCFDFAQLKHVNIREANGQLKSIGKCTNVRINKYGNVYFHNIEYLLKKGAEKFLKKYGLIYVPYSLHIKRNEYSEPMGELNNIVVFIRTLGKYHRKEEFFYSTDLKNILLFQDKKVEQIFYRAITEDKHIKEILEDEKINYKWY
jgi:hypothetical protein